MKESGDGGLSADEMYARYLAGDEAALDGLVALFERELTEYIYSLVGDPDMAKELMIESLARLATRRKLFRRSPVKTDLYAIAKNLAANQRKPDEK